MNGSTTVATTRTGRTITRAALACWVRLQNDEGEKIKASLRSARKAWTVDFEDRGALGRAVVQAVSKAAAMGKVLAMRPTASVVAVEVAR